MQETIQCRFSDQSEFLYDILAGIQKRPEMYLGNCSISRLRSYLDGYCGSRTDFGLPMTRQEEEFAGFQDWIQARYKITSAHGWDQIILFYSCDEKDALDRFFQLLDEFRAGVPAERSHAIA
jgi:hypothetical protein